MNKNEFAIAIKCVILNENTILLLKKTEREMIGDASNNSWDLPGGRVGYKETTEQAVEREIKEETAICIEDLQLKAASTVIRPDGIHLVILLYSCQSNERKIMLSEEHSMYKWFEYDELMKDASIPEWIKEAVDKCL